ncbi:hypothetical protein D3C84_580670 [compost metagenome]
MPGNDQPTGLQLRNGFAHDGSADAMLGHDLRFCRQFLPGLQCAAGDALAQHLGEYGRQVSGLVEAFWPAMQGVARRDHDGVPISPISNKPVDGRRRDVFSSGGATFCTAYPA